MNTKTKTRNEQAPVLGRSVAVDLKQVAVGRLQDFLGTRGALGVLKKLATAT